MTSVELRSLISWVGFGIVLFTCFMLPVGMMLLMNSSLPSATKEVVLVFSCIGASILAALGGWLASVEKWRVTD